jgi:peptide/nickel transport system substrate-binding protein
VIDPVAAGHHRPGVFAGTAPIAVRVLLPVLLAVAACGEGGDGDSAPGPGAGQTAVVCLGSQPEALDAFASPDLLASDLLPVLYTPLLRYGRGTGFEPGLARDWAWSDDLLELVLVLRDDVLWHDGERVTAADVVWTIRTAADPDYGYWQGEDFAALDTAYARGPDTVVVRLTGPDAAVTEAVGRLPVLPRHLLVDMAPEELDRAGYHREPVGNGPYAFVERRPDGSVLLSRNDRHPADLGRGTLDRILLRPITETTSQLVELRTGNVDACVTAPGVAEQVEDAGSLRGIVTGPFGVQVLPLRVDRPPLDDARVRRALSAAIDRSEIARISSPLAEPAGTFMPRSSPFRSDSLLQPDADPGRAAALLDSAGWRIRDGDDIRTDGSGRPLTFTITAPQQARDVLTLVQGQLRRVGVDVELELMETAAYFGLLQDPDRRPTAMALIFSPAKLRTYDPFAELHSEGFSNLGGYSSARVDSLIERLARTADPDARTRIYHELQRRVAEDVPMLYTIYLPRLFAVGEALQGVEVTDAGPFATVTDWRLVE